MHNWPIPSAPKANRVIALCVALGFVVLVVSAFLPGCSTPGYIKHSETVTDPSGVVTTTETTIRAPKDHIDSAHFMRRVGDGFTDVSASTGAGQGIDFALQQLGTYLIPTGIALVLFGALGMGASLFSFKIPLVGPMLSKMPRGVSAAAIVVGGVFIASPLMLDRYAWLITVGVVVALVVGAIVSYQHNGKLLPWADTPKEPA